jgi:hypothetical protein
MVWAAALVIAAGVVDGRWVDLGYGASNVRWLIDLNSYPSDPNTDPKTFWVKIDYNKKPDSNYREELLQLSLSCSSRTMRRVQSVSYKRSTGDAVSQHYLESMEEQAPETCGEHVISVICDKPSK